MQRTIFESDKGARLTDLKLRIDKCEKCECCYLDINQSDFVRGFGKVSFKVNPHAKILFIALNPSCKRDSHNDAPFSNREYEEKRGKSGLLFFRYLDEYGIFEKDVCVANLCACSTLNNELTDEMINNCKAYIYELIDILKPKIIVTMGAKVMIEGFEVIKMYHPSAILRNSNLTTEFENQWKELQNKYYELTK